MKLVWIFMALGVLLAGSSLLAVERPARSDRELIDDVIGPFNKYGNTPYLVVAGGGRFHGRYYARCTPDNDEGTQGTTKIYRVERDADELVGSFPWYAPKVLHSGIWLGGPFDGKWAVLRMHEEPSPLTDDRVELSIFWDGKLVKSFTVKELMELGAKLSGGPDPRRPRLNYSVSGLGFGGVPERYNWTFVIDNKKVIYVDPWNGSMECRTWDQVGKKLPPR